MFAVCTWITQQASWGKMKGRLQKPRQNGDRERRETGRAYFASGLNDVFYLFTDLSFEDRQKLRETHSEDLQAVSVAKVKTQIPKWVERKESVKK